MLTSLLCASALAQDSFTVSDLTLSSPITVMSGGDFVAESTLVGGSVIEATGGDFILGDRDGVVVIPKAAAAEVIARTEDCVRTESDLRRAIRNGEDPQQAYLKYGKF
jgi:regulator of RNase E activity RraA